MEDRISEHSEPETTPGSDGLEEPIDGQLAIQAGRFAGTATLSRTKRDVEDGAASAGSGASDHRSAPTNGSDERDTKGSKESHVTIKSPSECEDQYQISFNTFFHHVIIFYQYRLIL